MIDIWEAKSKKEGINELPENIKRYIPNFEYLLYDISRYTDEEIKGHAKLIIALTLYRDIFTKQGKDLEESILRSLEYRAELEDKLTGMEYFETVMRYIFSAKINMTETESEDMIKVTVPGT